MFYQVSVPSFSKSWSSCFSLCLPITPPFFIPVNSLPVCNYHHKLPVILLFITPMRTTHLQREQKNCSTIPIPVRVHIDVYGPCCHQRPHRSLGSGLQLVSMGVYEGHTTTNYMLTREVYGLAGFLALHWLESRVVSMTPVTSKGSIVPKDWPAILDHVSA